MSPKMSPKCRRDFRGLNPLSHKELDALNFEFGTRHPEGGRSNPPRGAHFFVPSSHIYFQPQ